MNAGTQVGKTVRLWFGNSGAKQTPFLGIKWDVGGEVIDSYTYLTDASMKMARKTIKILGMDIDAPDCNIEDLVTDPKYIGVEAELDIQEEEYNDQVQLKVKWINAIRSGPPENFDFKGIHAKLKAAGSEKSKAKAAGRAAAKPSEIKLSQAAEEDIPF